MQDLNDLYFFARVVEHGGFAPAGRALGIPKSRLSRRIALLEERLGVRLIQRSSRRFAVTEIGRAYHGHCLAMLVEAEAAQELIESRRAEPSGIVKVSCPTALLYFHVGGMLTRFMTENPRVEIRLESTNRRVDVIREGFDLAIRVRFPPLEESDLVMRVLAPSPQCLVASPAMLDDVSLPLAPADLAGLASLGWSGDPGGPGLEQEWCLDGPDGGTALIRHAPRLVTEDMVALRLAALAGLGVVQLPSMMVEDDLRAGTLVRVLEGWAPRAGIVHAIFPSRRGLLPAVRALIDALARYYAELGEASGQTARS